jgi:hypothetical protein
VAVGLTISVAPVAIEALTHEPAYQTHVEPVPKEPPTTERVEDTPGHTAVAEADIDEGSVDNVFNVIVELAHVVILQVPVALI